MSTSAHVRFQLLSDLHLEFPLAPYIHQYESYKIPPRAPYLLLAGDIGLLHQLPWFTSFLTRTARDFERIFLVLGNHEFYRTSRSGGLAAAAELERELQGKLTVLHRNRVDLGDVTILGCTLHSQLDPARVPRIVMGLNDFHMVAEWGPDDYIQEHQADLAWLRTEVAKVEDNRRILIVTHHAPLTTGTSDPIFKGSPFRSAFASDILGDGWQEWEGREKVKVWAFGHTHWCCDFVEESSGVRVVANQGGYAREGKEGECVGFTKALVVEV